MLLALRLSRFCLCGLAVISRSTVDANLVFCSLFSARMRGLLLCRLPSAPLISCNLASQVTFWRPWPNSSDLTHDDTTCARMDLAFLWLDAQSSKQKQRHNGGKPHLISEEIQKFSEKRRDSEISGVCIQSLWSSDDVRKSQDSSNQPRAYFTGLE
ncbi:hypothetical protein C8J56DRAFT_899817 [Mycena floridula]|nr:hypothetical protein C8J56DRAFT_899817 [Mycena floridula]